ncbi:MAG TPA: LysR family transcriptional regulator [Candidatus Dormibacteraeota bacterium]|nr:LysR family transcriptional regulator [Candidatus Dormibacteraeota bacterium]
MLLSQMQGFLEVARRGNVSRAAEAIYVSQPTLTARLHALESEVGEKLFVRTRQGMRLTDAGRVFLPFAERATQAVREGREAIAELNSASAGHLVLASAPACSTYLLPPVLERFGAEHPRVEVAVRTGHSEDVLQMVLKSEVQLGLGRELRHHDIEVTPFHQEELVLMVAPIHRFSGRGSVSMGELAGEQLILFDRTSSYYELTQASFASAGLTPRGMFELDNIEAAKKMVERNLGVALLPRTAVVAEVAAGTLRRVAISDGLPLRRRLVVMRRRDLGPATGVVKAFVDLLLKSEDLVPALSI